MYPDVETANDALDRAIGADICKIKGHNPPAISWYDNSLHDTQRCLRCGAEVQAVVDMSGHP